MQMLHVVMKFCFCCCCHEVDANKNILASPMVMNTVIVQCYFMLISMLLSLYHFMVFVSLMYNYYPYSSQSFLLRLLSIQKNSQ